MRLGMPVPKHDDPDESLAWAKAHGFRAVYVDERWCADEAAARAHGERIRAAGLVAAEVGAWGASPMHPDPQERKKGLDHCIRCLGLAEAAGARCCVNIVSALDGTWVGPCAQDLSDAAFNQVVESVRTIVDAVKPTRTFYTLETMQWMLPDSAEIYAALLDAIDRPGVAAHFDPVNLVNCPRRYYENAALIADFVRRLGPRIRCVHAKDVMLGRGAIVHLDECRPGLGALDYRALLRQLSGLDPDLPLVLEHLPSTEEYLAGAAFIRAVASDEGVSL